jgi:hypothetical protein
MSDRYTVQLSYGSGIDGFNWEIAADDEKLVIGLSEWQAQQIAARLNAMDKSISILRAACAEYADKRNWRHDEYGIRRIYTRDTNAPYAAFVALKEASDGQ